MAETFFRPTSSWHMLQTKPTPALMAAALLSLPLAALAQQVEPKIHKLCIEAKDYAGCVKAMTGEASAPQRVITQQGADIAEGNQCPTGYAYVGGGNCQQVECKYSWSGLGTGNGHNQILAGKSWKCKWSWVNGAGELALTGATSRATINPSCPAGEPPLGWNSTCEATQRKAEAN